MTRRFAQINSEGFVLRVIVADSAKWCEQVLGGVWLETFKDASQRFNHAAIGYTYDEERDAFIPPKPFESWVLDEATCLWIAPVPYPEVELDEDGEPLTAYVWDETAGEWVVSE